MTRLRGPEEGGPGGAGGCPHYCPRACKTEPHQLLLLVCLATKEAWQTGQLIQTGHRVWEVKEEGLNFLQIGPSSAPMELT